MDKSRLEEKARKIFALAERAGTPEEAATAANILQDFLVAHNLDMATIEHGNNEGSGKREDAKVRGGFHGYERELWRAIAELHFCMYFSTKEKTIRRSGLQTLSGVVIREPTFQRSFHHRIIGRTVNTSLTRTTADYLLTTIERLCRERIAEDNHQYYSSWSLAFREGAADRIVEKLRARRAEKIGEEERRAAADETAQRNAAGSGVSTATTLTITSVTKSEEAANYDFLHGEGAWAKREQRRAQWDKEAAEDRARQARADAAAEAAYTRWAKANPEEAARQERKAEAEERRRLRRSSLSWGRYRQPTAKEQREDSGAYQSGRKAAERVGIEPQMNKAEVRSIG